ncbi:hypothetical protein I4U23_022477 [Adineta vaga]|nr:hypothetical protein I4U23_022477 [Adineta vaga]
MFEQQTMLPSEIDTKDIKQETISRTYDRCFHLDIVARQIVFLFHTTIDNNIIASGEKQIQERINNINSFNNVDQCEEFLKQTNNITTFLIVSDQYEQSFVPKIIHMKHIWSIMIYHQNTNINNQQLRRTELKKRVIHTDDENLSNDLIKIIQQETNYIENVVFDNLTSTEEHGTTTDDSPFPSRIDFLDFLCYIPNPPNYFQRCITFLEQYFQGTNSNQLEDVKQFAENYPKTHNAIHWYTRDAFIYRLLNIALRRYDIKTLFFFSFFIKDLQKQLKTEHAKYRKQCETNKQSIVKVYRGQLMSPNEINQLKDNHSIPWLVNNSFFSTTLNRNVALIYLNNQSNIENDDELKKKEWLDALRLSWLIGNSIEKESYTEALNYSNESLTIFKKFVNDKELNSCVDIARIYERLARCYQYNIQDENLAEKWYLECIFYLKNALKYAVDSNECIKIYYKLTLLERHRRKLNGYNADEMEMIIRYEELRLANALDYYRNDKAQLAEAFKQKAELRKVQFDYKESLVNYQCALDIFLEEPFEFDFYLKISDIIDNMIKIYEENYSDYSTAIRYQLIKHQYISERMKYISLSQRRCRHINQCDLAQCKIELAIKYLIIEEEDCALMHLTEVIALYYDLGDTRINDWKTIHHYQLQEIVADRFVQSELFLEAYDHMKMSIRLLEGQKWMLEYKMEIQSQNIIALINHNRDLENLKIKQSVLESKLDIVRQLSESFQKDEEEIFEKTCLTYRNYIKL